MTKRQLSDSDLTEKVLSVAAAIASANANELNAIIELVTARRNILQMKAAINLTPGSLVEFTLESNKRKLGLPKGSKLIGTLKSIDAKYCKVETIGYGTWRVPPSMIHPVT